MTTTTLKTAQRNAQKPNIRHLTEEALQQWMQEQHEPKFRVKQVQEWLWQKGATNFEEMTNLGKGLRNKLSDHFATNALQVAQQQVSSDGTIKFAFQLHDGHLVEGVLIPTSKRMTACVSSQVGCSLSCSFCATGKLKLVRNLTFDEIYDQVRLIDRAAQEQYNMPLTNIVYMGMGEPLLNYRNMLQSVERITSPQGLNMAPWRITVSTAGIAKMIKRLADDAVRFNLALSLHAANDAKRSRIMGINDTNNLAVLAEALREFYDKTGNTITFEYVLLRDFNDSEEDARELVAFARKVPSKVNLIEYNPIGDGAFDKSRDDRAERFQQYLEQHRVGAYLRKSRGEDIDAACGQLANKQ